MILECTFTEVQDFNALFDIDEGTIDLSFEGLTIVEEPIETYTGSYTATPSVCSQEFPTAQKKMTDDFTVVGIPKFDTLNEKGGYTCNIGG